MPADKITLDEGIAATQERPITLDEAMAAQAATMRPRSAPPGGVPLRSGEELIPGQGLPGAPNFRPPMVGRAPVAAEDANFGTALSMNLLEDEPTKRRVLAESLFPNDPNGINRVGFWEGRPVFVNDDGMLQYASGAMSRTGAAMIANAPEMIGGTVGSFAGSPVWGAALGAGGARGIKRGLTGLIYDEPQTIAGNLGGMALEGGLNAAGALAGRGAAAILNRNRIIDFTPKQLTNAERARLHVKNRTGIDLDIAQASGDRKLLAIRDFASRYPGKAADLIEVQDDLASGQFNSAVNRVLDMVATASPREVAGERAISAAQAAMALSRKKLQQEVKPLYDAAYQTATEITDPDLLALLQVKPIAAAVEKARGIINLDARRVLKEDESKISLQLLDYTKQTLDDEVERLAAKGLNNEARALAGARDQIRDALDSASETWIKSGNPQVPSQQIVSLYQQARAQYGQLYQTTITPIENSPVGVLAQMHPKNAHLAARVLNDPEMTPQQIAVLKGGLSRSDPQAYKGLVRSWLAQQWNKSQQVTQAGDVINPAGKFLKRVMTTPDQRDRVVAMLPPNAAQALEDVMYAAEKLATTPLGASRVAGSNTARDLQLTEALKGSAYSALRWLISPRQSIKDAAEQRALESGIESLTEALIDPTKRAQLRQISRMKPSTQQLFLLSGVLGTQASGTGISGSTATQLPAEMRQ